MNQLKIQQIAKLTSTTDWKTQAVMMQEGRENKIDSVNWKEFPYQPEVKFYIAWAGKSLFLLYDVKEDAVRAVNTEYHSSVYQDSCVEFFMQHPGSPFYRNFEFNCIGAVLGAIRKNREEYRHLDVEDMDKIKIHADLSIGNIPEKGPYHWQLLAEIPFEVLDIPDNPQGTSIRANCYKCGDETPVPHFLSWNPVVAAKPDFHRPECFGEMIFE